MCVERVCKNVLLSRVDTKSPLTRCVDRVRVDRVCQQGVLLIGYVNRVY